MPKIIYLITQSELGGAQKNVLDLAVSLKNDYEILVAAGPEGQGQLLKELEKQKIKTKKLSWLRRSVNPLFDFLAFWEIKNLLKKEKPDILHLHSSKAGILGSLAASPKTKIVYTVHGAVFEAAFSSLAKKIFLMLEKWTARFKNKIICVSQNDKNLWLKNKVADEKKLVVIHNGLNIEKLNFLPQETARKELENFIKHPLKNVFLVGTIANLYPEKGLLYLIKAAKIIKKHELLSNFIFIVIGEGRQRKLLEKMIKERELENVFFLTGALPQASLYLKAFDSFVLPSIKEGFPYTILEAMAAGLPIVTSAVGGIPEIIQNKKNGLLIFSKNPKAIAESLVEIAKNKSLKDNLSFAAKKRSQDFTLDKMIYETKKVYQEL